MKPAGKAEAESCEKSVFFPGDLRHGLTPRHKKASSLDLSLYTRPERDVYEA
jgi:hypothetical protein